MGISQQAVNPRALLVILEENHAHTLKEVAFEIRSTLEACRIEAEVIYPVPEEHQVPTLMAVLRQCADALAHVEGQAKPVDDLLMLLRALTGSQGAEMDLGEGR